MVAHRLFVGLAMAAVALPILYMLRIARQHSDSPGSRGFMLVLPGAALWSVTSGALALTSSMLAFRLAWGGHILAASLLALGWALMALDYTRRERVDLSRVHWAALLAIPVATQVLYWTNPWHGLVVDPATSISGAGVVSVVNGPWFYVHAGYNYLALALPGTLLLARDFLRAKGVHRQQTGVLLLGAAVAIVTSVGFTLDLPIPPYVDPAPFGYLVTMSLWTGAVFRFELFTTVPIGRRAAIDTIPDAFVLFDPNWRLVDANPAAREVLDLGAEPAGTDVAAALDPLGDLAARMRAGDPAVDTVTVRTDGERRHFSVTVEAVDYGGTRNGTLLLLRDVTSLVRRERYLDLLQTVLSRVLRHNLRNDLQAIRGRAERIAARSDGDVATDAETIVGLVDELTETSKKARNIEAVLDAPESVVDQDLVAVTERAVDAVEARRDAEIRTDLPDSATAMAHYNIQDAIENLLENAIDHGDDGRPVVRVTPEDGSVCVAVVDDGPGIPEHEVAVLDSGEETTLEHGTGAGLWLATTLAETSGGDLEFAVDDGTTAALSLPRAEA